ncbi:MAG: DUF512 domain-containing protein [Thermincolia bacterium]
MDKGGAVVAGVRPGSIAEEVGIEVGDIVTAINGFSMEDLIDYRFQVAGEYIELELHKIHGEEWVLEIGKDYDEGLGLEFTQSTFDGIKRCQNRCVFCFVDQMPLGMRDTLYIKDDDYRMSVLHGNFITGTNLTAEQVNRIVRFRLSPIYFSVHTTNPGLRVKMLNNKQAGDIIGHLEKMVAAGLEIHTQIVLCPGVNDGAELDSTIKDLGGFYPQVQSIAVVPVGLTRFREGLFGLKTFDAQGAGAVIKQVSSWQQNFRIKYQDNLIYLADEFYLLAGEGIPAREHYGEFPQTENGVGLVRLFLDSFAQGVVGLPRVVEPARKVSLATGISGAKVLKGPVEQLNGVAGLEVQLIPITNNYFGNQVTVAGLLTGQDLIQGLQGIDLGQQLILPSVMCKAGEPVFLDGITVKQLEEELAIPVEIVDAQDGCELIAEMLR